eukprot:g5999.t1
MKYIALLSVFVLSNIVAFAPSTNASSQQLLKPIKQGAKAVGVVFIQGAQIPAEAYLPLAKQIQIQSSLSVYVVIPSFPLNTPEPLVLSNGIKNGVQAMYDAGLDKDADLIMMGHSLGGAMLQDYVFKCKNCKAQVLMGAGLLRKYRNGSTSSSYPVNTLTIDGTLDGLYRVTRQAENYYHYVLHAKYDKPINFPVVVYEGVSHMQFASGPAPFLVKKSDLKPTVSEAVAHNMTARTIALYMDVQLQTVNAGDAAKALQQEMEQTGALVQPLIDALVQEGFKHFVAPCNTDYNMPSQCPFYPRYPGKQRTGTNPSECLCGTPWTSKVAMQVMGGLGEDTKVTYDVVDGIHAVSDVNPIHLPHVWSPTCQNEDQGCTLNLTTVTQQVYSSLDSFDTGYSYTSASELRVKMMSRQSVWLSVGRKNVNFTQTDVVPDICADINKLAWQYALKNAGPEALKRFNDIGEPLAFGKDLGPYNAGPLWIYNALKYENAKDESKMTIQSPMMHTDVDYKIKAAAGFHYCKLLSPARAMEWLYIDGLRAKGGL